MVDIPPYAEEKDWGDHTRCSHLTAHSEEQTYVWLSDRGHKKCDYQGFDDYEKSINVLPCVVTEKLYDNHSVQQKCVLNRIIKLD